MRIAVILIIFCKIISVSCSTDNYCDICPASSHVLCKYKKGPSVICYNYRGSEINDDVKTFITELHNKFRSKVAQGLELKGSPGPQPPASNMLIIEWDEELANIAQRIADQCFDPKQKFVDSCRLTSRFPYGIMIASMIYNKDANLDITYAFKYWYNHVQHFNASNVHRFELSSNSTLDKYRFYTQMVWAETRFIGCGHAVFQKNSNPQQEKLLQESKHFIHRLVCNYGPAGNIIKTPVYKKGSACSFCPKGYVCSKDYAGLCVNASLNDAITGDDSINQIEIDFSEGVNFNKHDSHDTKSPALNYIPAIYNTDNIRSKKEEITISTDINNDSKTELGNEIKQRNKPPKSSHKLKVYKGVWKFGSCKCDISIRSNSWKLSIEKKFTYFFKSVLMYFIIPILYST